MLFSKGFFSHENCISAIATIRATGNYSVLDEEVTNGMTFELPALAISFQIFHI